MPAKLKLKPCPFCGSKDVKISGNETDHYCVECCNDVCFCSLGEMYLTLDEANYMFGDKESAVYNWNKRAEIADMPRLKAEILHGLDRIEHHLLSCDTELIGVAVDEIREKLLAVGEKQNEL